jgi:outer membrane protein
LIRQTKEKEIVDLQERLQNFQQTAQQDIQQKEAELWQPVIDKANNAIQEVGKENGFTYIFDVSAGVVLYFSPESIDVLPLVKTKLGITTTTE